MAKLQAFCCGNKEIYGYEPSGTDLLAAVAAAQRGVIVRALRCGAREAIWDTQEGKLLWRDTKTIIPISTCTLDRWDVFGEETKVRVEIAQRLHKLEYEIQRIRDRVVKLDA